MKQRRIFTGPVILMLLLSLAATGALSATTPAQLKACHDYVWDLSQFKSLPNAAISVHSGDPTPNAARVHWRVEWDGQHAKGGCLVNEQGRVVKEWASDAKSSTPEPSHLNGIFFDTRSGKWRDGQGVCATCTPSNGFPIPQTDGPFYWDSGTRQWRDSLHQGAVCATCTVENGFATPN